WALLAARAVRRPMLVLGIGVLAFAALGLAALGYRTASLSRSATAPAGAAAGNALIAQYFPRSAASPSNLVFRYATPAWQHPDTLAAASSSLSSSGLF